VALAQRIGLAARGPWATMVQEEWSSKLKDMQQLTNVHDINENSLIVYMYPPKEDLEEQINSYIENKNCYIYYPWK
jgi:hypothetical protein